MTLIELMIVLLVSVIVLGAALTMYQVSARYYVVQDALLEQQQNLRSALYLIGRDVRMSGNGLHLMNVNKVGIYIDDAAFGEGMGGAGWFRYRQGGAPGVRPIFGEDGTAENKSDALTIFHTDMESANPLGTLAMPYNAGSTRFVLTERLLEEALNDGDMVAVSGGGEVVIFEADEVSYGADSSFAAGDRFRPRGVSFPEGASVHRLRDVTLVRYYLGKNNKLMANYYDFTGGSGVSDSLYGETGGPQILADDIEDFQVQYIMDQQAAGANLSELEALDEISEAFLDSGRSVRAVKIAIVSKSRVANESTAAGRPLSVFNHTVDGKPDGFLRRILTDTIYLRNF